jgi:hypothetical protein
VQSEAARDGQSRSQRIGSIVMDLFQGQELRAESRRNFEFIERHLAFAMCALDGLLAEHPDHTLRERVREAYRRKAEQLAREKTS